MEAAGALASLAPSPITVLGLIPLLALGITYFRYQQFDPESYITDVNTVSIFISIRKTLNANTSGLWPDIQFHMAPASFSSDNGQIVRKILGLTDEVYDTVYRPIANKDAWTIMPLLLRPNTRGYVRLRSSNPFHYPLKYK